MASFTPCAGSGQQAVNIWRAPSQQDGLGMTRAKTFGDCPVCGRVQMSYGLVQGIKVTRHKETPREDTSPYVADPLNPTDEELSAAIQRGLDNGSLIDAADWMAQNAAELGK
jgi:hypothetical protein